MINVIIKKYRKNQEIVDYLFFGIITTIFSLCTYYFLVILILNPNKAIELQIANVVSWIVGVTVAYVTNRKYVFRSNNKKIIKELLKFTSSRIITLLLDMTVMFLGVTIFRLNDKVFKLISSVIVVIGNYLLSKIFVFKSH